LIAAARGVELTNQGRAHSPDGEITQRRRPRRHAQHAARPPWAPVEHEPARAHADEPEGSRIECHVEERLPSAQLGSEGAEVGTNGGAFAR
jgi:hypothetical protein